MSEPEPRESERKRFNLHTAYKGEEEKLLVALRTGREVAGHPVAQGQGTESNWHAVLVDVLPKRYQVSTGFVVDSRGSQSDQIDLIIRDAHFSPLFWEFGGFLYVPAESVYAVFEVRQTINRENVLYASDKGCLGTPTTSDIRLFRLGKGQHGGPSATADSGEEFWPAEATGRQRSKSPSPEPLRTVQSTGSSTLAVS